MIIINEIITLGNYSPSKHNASRVISIEGIAPTVMENHGTVTAILEIKREVLDLSIPKLIGGIGEINFGKQFRQGNRVYDSNEIAMCLLASPLGNAGGYSYLYSINKNNGGMKMWKNNLEKCSFNIEELRVFDVFSGIGALHKSLKMLGVPVKITNISEIDPDAIISYAGIHIENFKNLEFEYPADKEMRDWLIDRSIGYSYDKEKSSIPRMKVDKLKLLYKASVLLNNLGDIAKIDYKSIEDFDLMNFSFSCTDLSNSGRQKGMVNEDGTPTRSGLYVYGIKAIREKKPKYIMIENVKGLIQKKFIDDFYSIISELEEIGYNCYYPTKVDKKGVVSPTCLNAKDFGIPQNRERIYVICIRKDIDDSGFEFPKGKDTGVRLKDLLEDRVDEKYYLSEKIQERFKLSGIKDIDHNEINTVGSSAPDFRTIGQRDITYGVNGIMSTLVATDYKQPKQILETNEVIQLGNIVDTGNWDNPQRGRIYSSQGTSPTLNTVGGGGLEPKIVVKEEEDNFFIDKKGRKIDYIEKENYIQWDISGKGYNSQQDRAFYEDGLAGTIPASNTSDKMNVILNNEKTVCEQRSDEGLRFFKDDCVGTLRTIDACGDKRVIENKETIKIRKLTPKECFRLMGFDDEDFDNAQALGVSDSQLYKTAGNSIVTNVLYYIFKNLFEKYIKN